MASMNNWLAFSLSPQEPVDHHHQSQTTVSRLGFNSDGISGTDVSGECFDLAGDSSVPSLNLPPPFGILEAFHRNSNQPQDWNMKGSELSMVMGGSSCNTQEPKLENFLGNHGCHTMYDTTTGQYSLYTTTTARTTNGGGDEDNSTNNNTNLTHGASNSNTNSGNSIGLSMIKTWLRNQPAPPQVETKNNGGGGSGGGGASQSLSLSMSTGGGGGGSGGESSSSDNKKTPPQPPSTGVEITQTGTNEAVARKSIDTFGQRTSIYRGVTRHRWTGRYEAHLWDNSCRREGQSRKGRQGGYDKEEKAARAYDLAALKYWGTTTTTNFPISNYEKELEEMKHMTRQEYVASLRRKSSGFSRGASMYRGVTRHHQHGRWQARIGRVAGNKDLYLGTFSTQEEAAEAYDIAAIKFRGLNAVTNFDMSRYDVKSILESSQLPIGGTAKRLKDVEQAEMAMDMVHRSDGDNINTHLPGGINTYGTSGWPTIAYQQAQPFSMHYPYGQRIWCKQEQDSDPDHAFHDLHQLQLGSTHNFFQPSVLHNLMAMESSSMEHSSGSNTNSVIYNNTVSDGAGYGGYAIPLGTVIPTDTNQNQSNDFGDNSNNEVKALGYENVYTSSTDPYHSRNMYYLSQQSSSSTSQASPCNNWVPTAVPTIAQRSSNMAVCHGAPTFTVWNDT
ncbi:hypothetical protein ERO13_D08G247400v2 [Gossypium hirsutum]|nr:hypothetical protein ERO13_D08G247400v2 [Gossypium hirsutum]